MGAITTKTLKECAAQRELDLQTGMISPRIKVKPVYTKEQENQFIQQRQSMNASAKGFLSQEDREKTRAEYYKPGNTPQAPADMFAKTPCSDDSSSAPPLASDSESDESRTRRSRSGSLPRAKKDRSRSPRSPTLSRRGSLKSPRAGLSPLSLMACKTPISSRRKSKRGHKSPLTLGRLGSLE